MQDRRYVPLADHLAAQYGPDSRLTFAEVAALLGPAGLPPAAYRPGHWWHNDWHQRHARDGWLRAGWRVATVDYAGEMVRFVRERGRGADT
jgi:hypothetical protein